MMKTKRGIFTVVLMYSVAVCVLSAAAAIGYGTFFTAASGALSEQNARQKAEFDACKAALGGINAQFAARFQPPREEELKTKLAQRGFTALLDNGQIKMLYGYDEIERILSNRTAEIPGEIITNPQEYNWPDIKLVSMVYDAATCSTMVELTGGENKGEQSRQVWKWERRNGQWVPIMFSNYFTARDIEISKQGVSFMLAPRHNTTLVKLFVLNN